MGKFELTRINGESVRGSDAYDEFSAAKLPWHEPGMIYRWIDRSARVLFERKRQGWKICSIEADFTAKGCPEHLLPVTDVTGTEIIFGESILAKMPITLYQARYKRNVLEKVVRKREANLEKVRAEGDRVAHELRARGAPIKGNVVEEVGAGEIQRDWNSNRDVTAADGRHVLGDGGPPETLRRRGK